MCAVGCIAKHPISSMTHHKLTNKGFDVIIVDSNVAVFNISLQQMLVVCSVSQRLAEFAFWRNIAAKWFVTKKIRFKLQSHTVLEQWLRIDEIARAKGHKYITLVYQLAGGRKRLLWVGENRKEDSLRGFFDWLTP